MVATAKESTARVIVQYKSGSGVMQALAARTGLPVNQRIPQHARVFSARYGVSMTDGAPISARSQVIFAKGMTSVELAKTLSRDPDVEFAEPDLRRRISTVLQPNDPLYGGGQTSNTPTVGQWYLRTPDASIPAAINATKAWNLSMGTSTVVVAVLDTGVRFEHPDLRGKLLPGYDMVADHDDAFAHANDGNGRDADASDPGDWVTDTEVNDPNSSFYQCTFVDSSGRYVGDNSSWHGTQVSGIIAAATDNSIGIASVARNVMVLPVRVLGRCEGFDSDIQAGMLWAAGISVPGVPDNTTPAKIINLSLGGGTGCSDAYQSVVNEVLARNVTIVASAGNAGLAVSAPAACSGVIAVAGVRHLGTKVGYSSLGPEVALSAPAGNCVNTVPPCLYPLATTLNTGTTTPRASSYSDSFVSSLGTSFSSPLVAGTAALMLSVNPSLTPAQVRSELRSTARTFPTTSPTAGVTQCQAPGSTLQDSECICTTSTCGAGLLDASAAVAAAVAARPTPAPTVTFQSTADEVMPGATVALDGSGTQAPSGRTIANYAWTISGTGASLSGTLNGPSASTINLSATAPGTVTVTLTVTDSIGDSSSVSKNITIASGPTAILFASTNSTTAGTAVSLDATASTAAGGRNLASYQWSIVAGSASATLSSTSGSSVTVTPNAGGTVTVQLTVTDGAGATGTTTSSITVTGGSSSGGGGSGGGGALGLGWLVALTAAVMGVARTRRSSAR